jgi:HlyD family secretion protein
MKKAATLEPRMRPIRPAAGHAGLAWRTPAPVPNPSRHRERAGANKGQEQTSQLARIDPSSWHAELTGRLQRAYDREVARGLRILLLALGIGGSLALLVPVAGAVVLTGALVSGTNSMKIQHPAGGVIEQILVRDGQHVQRGAVVVKLNEVAARASLDVIEQQLDQARAQIARLTAERDNLPEPKWPAELLRRAANARVAGLIESEKSQFDARQTAYSKQVEILKHRASQLEQERAGYQSQAAANEKQKKYVSLELEGLEKLYKQQLVPLSRLSAVAREAARLEGELGQLTSNIAEHASKIDEANVQISAAAQARRVEVTKELTEARAKLAELLERRAAAKDVADHVEIRAPRGGTIHQLAVHTIGGVVAPGEVLMLIAPDGDDLVVEARLPPNQIDQVSTRQSATVRFSAFDRSTTPELHGSVTYVSPDVVHDSHSGATYYSVKVVLAQSELQRLGNLKLVSGMPVEVFLQTGNRTILSYLLKPLSDQVQRVMRER